MYCDNACGAADSTPGVLYCTAVLRVVRQTAHRVCCIVLQYCVWCGRQHTVCVLLYCGNACSAADSTQGVLYFTAVLRVVRQTAHRVCCIVLRYCMWCGRQHTGCVSLYCDTLCSAADSSPCVLYCTAVLCVVRQTAHRVCYLYCGTACCAADSTPSVLYCIAVLRVVRQTAHRL